MPKNMPADDPEADYGRRFTEYGEGITFFGDDGQALDIHGRPKPKPTSDARDRALDAGKPLPPIPETPGA